MKIQDTIKKETLHVAVGSVIGSILIIIVYISIGQLNIHVLLSCIFGSAIVVFNFLALGITLQKALQEDEKHAQLRVKASYNGRMIVLFILFGILIATGLCEAIPLIISLIFPKLTIFFLNKLVYRKRKEAVD